MKTIELKTRVRTTEGARKEVIPFINSFDFTGFSDIKDIESVQFPCVFDIDGNKHEHDTCSFALMNGRFEILSVNTEFNSDANPKEWVKFSEVFDSTCRYIHFPSLVKSMEDFVAKINKAVDQKEAEILEFLNFCEEYKSFKATVKAASEVAVKEEKI
jgi:hypothetical protein